VEAITLVPETADRQPEALIGVEAVDIGIARIQVAIPGTATTRRRSPPDVN